MSKFPILLLLVGLLLWGCEPVERQYETTVSGRVLTNNTQDFPGDTALPVEFIGGSGLSGGEAVRQTHYTDELGHFSFSFTADNTGDKWYIRVPHTHTPPLHYNMSTAGGVPVKVGDAQTMAIKLKPFAWLKLHVVNVNPMPGDLLSVNWGGGISPNFYGSSNDTVVLKGGGNFYRMFSFSLFRNNEWTNFKDSVYLPAFDTTYYLLEY